MDKSLLHSCVACFCRSLLLPAILPSLSIDPISPQPTATASYSAADSLPSAMLWPSHVQMPCALAPVLPRPFRHQALRGRRLRRRVAPSEVQEQVLEAWQLLPDGRFRGKLRPES